MNYKNQVTLQFISENDYNKLLPSQKLEFLPYDDIIDVLPTDCPYSASNLISETANISPQIRFPLDPRAPYHKSDRVPVEQTTWNNPPQMTVDKALDKVLELTKDSYFRYIEVKKTFASSGNKIEYCIYYDRFFKADSLEECIQMLEEYLNPKKDVEEYQQSNNTNLPEFENPENPVDEQRDI